MIVIVDSSKETARKLGDKFDIGLNITSRKKMLIVPELARCGVLNKKLSKQEYYDTLELSHETVQLLSGLKAKFENIFTVLDKKIKARKFSGTIKVSSRYILSDKYIILNIIVNLPRSKRFSLTAPMRTSI